MIDRVFAGLSCLQVSEIAPAYVLDALEPREADAVRGHLAACPEAHADVEELWSTVPVLLETVELLEPPPTLRVRILEAAAAEAGKRRVDTGHPTQSVYAPSKMRRPTQRPQRPQSIEIRRARVELRRPTWIGIGLAAAAIVALGAWNLALRNEIEELRAYTHEVAVVLDRAAQPGAHVAVLAAPDAHDGPSGIAAITVDGAVALVMQNLQPTSGTQVYQTWLIAAGAAPVPIGDFSVGASGTVALVTTPKTVGHDLTLALTLEPAPGATTPTMPVVAAGAAHAQDT